MSSPVDEIHNPFEELLLHPEQPRQLHPAQHDSYRNSMDQSGPPSPQSDKPREKKRVGFTGDSTPRSASLTPGESGSLTPEVRHDSDPGPSVLRNFRSHLPHLSAEEADQIREAFAARIARPRPALRHSNTRPSIVDSEDDSDGLDNEKAYRRQKAREALQRGKALEEENVRTLSAPASPLAGSDDGSVGDRRPSDLDITQAACTSPNLQETHDSHRHWFRRERTSGHRSGTATPQAERDYIEDYQPEPSRYHAGVLGAILELREKWSTRHGRNDDEQHSHPHARAIGPQLANNNQYLTRRTSKGDMLGTSPEPSPMLGPTPTDSGTSTPHGWRSPWYFGSRQHSTTALNPQAGPLSFGDEVTQRLRKHKEDQRRPSLGERMRSSGVVESLCRLKARMKEQHRIERHISEVLQRQKYLLKLCRALIAFGAPTHRLEEYLNMSARALSVDAHFLYLPGAMIISFQDESTHTTNLQLVKEPAGLHLSKMRDVHEIYKEVVHDRISAHEGLKRIHSVTSKPITFWEQRLVLLFFYGLASMSVAPFAFSGQWIDLGPCFVLGCFVGFLHLWVAQFNSLYSDLFAILASIVTSFASRLLGSFNLGHGAPFCFAALAQSSLALILPGYMVLTASLELQSRNFIAGSVRMVHAIIYSLTLGFGIMIGTAAAGAALPTSTSDLTCRQPISSSLNLFFVLVFTISLMVINRASLKQAPSMIVVSLLGYAVNYYTSQHLRSSTQIASALGALTIGFLANAYSRFSPRVMNWLERTVFDRWTNMRARRPKQVPKELEEGKLDQSEDTKAARLPRIGRSLAAAVMLPAILVQVPSGISIGGSLVSGLEAANMLTSNITMADAASAHTGSDVLNTTAFAVGFSVIQVALSITVGLFVAALMMYPFGKRRSALFSF